MCLLSMLGILEAFPGMLLLYYAVLGWLDSTGSPIATRAITFVGEFCLGYGRACSERERHAKAISIISLMDGRIFYEGFQCRAPVTSDCLNGYYESKF